MSDRDFDPLARSISEELDELAPIFDELTLWSARFGILLLDHLELRPPERGLDLGCGTGFPLLELATMHGPGSSFVGVDTWASALAVARTKIARHRMTNVEVVEADAAELPFEDGTFSLITSNLGLNNFADAQGAAHEAFRVCEPGGRLVLATNPTGTLPEIYEAMRSVLRDVAPDAVDALDAQEQHRGTEASCRRLLTEAGFVIRAAVRDQFSMRFADGRALFRHVLVACMLEGWRSALPEGREIEILNEVQARLNGPFEATVQMLVLEAERPR